MFRTLLPGAAFAILILNGLIHGLWTERWTVPNELAVSAAGAKLDQVGITLGTWDGQAIQGDPKLLPEEIIGQYVLRRYLNRNHGSAVTLFLVGGPTRRMWQGHLPLECYRSAGYEVVGSPTKYALPADSSPIPAEFWVATFSKDEMPAPTHLRVFWAWSGSGSWQAPDYPHRAFAGCPFLYKLYVVRQLVEADEPLEGDPGIDFLRVLVPELRRALFSDP
jgi:hypothetical protein